MARSLTVRHEEAATTSSLFTGFLLLALACLLLSALTWPAAPDAHAEPAPQAVER